MSEKEKDFAFECKRLPRAVDLSSLTPWFDNLPQDHYVGGNFRRRRLSRFRGPAEHLVHLPHDVFVQANYVNQLLGNIRRDYEELEPGLIREPSFRALIQATQDFFGFDPQSTVLGVHQIRIKCSSLEQGEPAPEGIHQDGFDWITIACMAREGVVGASTRLYANPKGEPLFSRELEPGDVVYCNDRTMYHYTTPIYPASDLPGHRDVFVITASLGVS